MNKFLPYQNELGNMINVSAAELYNRLRKMRINDLSLPSHCLEYFETSHLKRLFFSIESSAHLLYRSISLKNKPTHEIVVMDYGAGVGSLYLLAKMIGCKVIYNDHLDDWKISASLIASAIGIKIDEYIVGDISPTLKVLNENKIQCDIIASRNVIEHIYNLQEFYTMIFTHQPSAIIYSSTTANFYNPASHLKHILWHRKWEIHYAKQRALMIQRDLAGGDKQDVELLTKATRGLAASDITRSITDYNLKKSIPDPRQHYTNTCDPVNGVWAEHLLSFQRYRQLIPKTYNVLFHPGFWDTHYSNGLKNSGAAMLNALIRINNTIGFILSPFIYVVAYPKIKIR